MRLKRWEVVWSYGGIEISRKYYWTKKSANFWSSDVHLFLSIPDLTYVVQRRAGKYDGQGW